MVVVDMEAGLEHLSWAGGTLRHADLLLVVTEPQAKSRLTARRTLALARQLGIPDVRLLGNRVREPRDEEMLRAFAAEQSVDLAAVLPHDEAVVEADRAGVCILDRNPDAPSVQAVSRLSQLLAPGRVAAGRPSEGPAARA